MMSDTPDTEETTPADTESGHPETPLRGSWRDKRATAAAFGISEKTVERRAKDGRIQQRDLPGNRVQFWVPADLLSGQSEDSDNDEPEEDERVLAMGGQVGLALVDVIRQELIESRQQIADLSRQLGQALAENDRLKSEQPRLTESTDTDTRPWWRFWG